MSFFLGDYTDLDMFKSFYWLQDDSIDHISPGQHVASDSMNPSFTTSQIQPTGTHHDQL
jgi:hypothetical protein